MKVRWLIAVLIVIAYFVIARMIVKTAKGQEESRLVFLPLISTAIVEPDPVNSTGVWREGVKIHNEFYESQPHYTLEVNSDGSEICSNLIMWNVIQQEYIPVDEGHWRDYDGWGKQYYQLTKSWIGRHLLESLRPSYYLAWCQD